LGRAPSWTATTQECPQSESFFDFGFGEHEIE